MKVFTIAILVVTNIVGTLVILLPDAGADSFRVGAAKIDITPSDGEIASGKIWLGGYGSCAGGTRRATGVHDKIFARAVIIAQGSTILALVMVDAIGVSNRRIKAIREKAHAATGIPIKNIMVGATHTHSAPDMQGLWCGVSTSYKEFFDTRVAQVVIDAWNAMRPAVLRARTTELHGLQYNRRGWPLMDTTLSVIQAREPAGAAIATLVAFAAHATFLGQNNTLISRDWPGGTQDQIEARGGGVAIVNPGDQGDIGPAWPNGGSGGAAEYGAVVGNAAYNGLSDAMQIDGPQVYLVGTRSIPITNGLFLTAYTAGWLDYDLTRCTPWATNPCVSTEIAYIRYGRECQVQVAVAPGEVLTRGGLRIKSAFVGENTMFLGLAHNTLGYAVPSDEWSKAPNGSRYEEAISPSPGFGDTVINTITSLVAGDGC